MATEEKDQHYDVRVVERNVKRGLVEKKDYEKHLKGLDDDAGKARPFDAQQPGAPRSTPDK